MTTKKWRVADVLREYPDCPQREMALRALRDGRDELAAEWLSALQELIEEGRARIESNRLVEEKRRA